MITVKMNVIDSTESTDTMTFINNEQSIIVIVYFLKFFTYCINSCTKTYYMELQRPPRLL